jgi:putative colanic acid biosynthesis glycosyltransferase WcaE
MIDGASTDGTEKLVAELRSACAYSCSEPDRGIYDAMNKGLRRARGDFVVFMNAGDVFARPTTLAKVAEVAQRTGDVGMIVCGCENRMVNGQRFFQPPRDIAFIRHSLPTSHQAMFFRAALHRQVPFNLTYTVSADYDAICRMYRLNPTAAYVNDTIAYAWRGAESNSLRRPWRMLLDMAQIQRRALKLSYPTITLSAMRRLLPVLAFYVLEVPVGSHIMYRLVLIPRPSLSPNRT